MDATNPPDKCWTVQHFPTGYPNTEWTPEALAAYAQAQHHAILDDERKLAAKYWRLGLALNALRKTFDHGQWERALNELSIEKSKASRARAIARTFETEEDVAGLTVKEAYGKRVKKKQPRSEEGASDEREAEPSRMGRFLVHVTETADIFVDDAGFAKEADAAQLLPAVDKAIAKLELIRNLLRQQASNYTN